MFDLKERVTGMAAGNNVVPHIDLRKYAKHAAPDGGSGASADRTPGPGPDMQTRPNLG